MRYFSGLILAICLLAVWVPAQAQQLAFPTAEGFGRFASGGRGGVVCKVTNLNDSGTGSLRSCLQQTGTRTIIFTVGGTITLSSQIGSIKSNVTLACQTAPGDGIMIKGPPVSGALGFQATNNVIVRHCRIRGPGRTSPITDNTNGVSAGQGPGINYVIFDHISGGWSTDDFWSCSSLTDGANINCTLQWSFISETLKQVSAGGAGSAGGSWVGGGQTSDIHTSYLHNLFSNIAKRTPTVGADYTQIINNVVYMCESQCIYAWAEYDAIHADIAYNWLNRGASNILTVGCGYASSWECKPEDQAASDYFIKGNVHTVRRPDASTGSEFAMVDIGGQAYTMQSTNRVSGGPVIPTETTAVASKAQVIARAGATVPKRDPIDNKVLGYVNNNTGGICGTGNPPPITIESCVQFPPYASAAAPADSDNDGIPDTWETQHGLNPNSPVNDLDGPKIASNGYSNLENYLNELAGDTVPTVSVPTPVAKYEFDNSADDAFGNYNGDLLGCPLFTTGKIGQAISLDGSHDYAQIPHASALNPSTAMTISAWVKMDTLDTNTSFGDTILMKGDWNFSNSYFLVFYQNSLRCGMGRAWNATLTYASSNFNPNQWYHIACRASSSGHAIFVNGVSVASNTTTAQAITNTNSLIIGANVSTTVGQFDGLIDDVRIYNTSLSNSDIQALATVSP